MQTDYSDQDTERVRHAATSSAGQTTQQLPNTVFADASSSNAYPTTVAEPARNNNNKAAFVLIAIGFAMLLGRFLPDRGELTGGMVLLTIASCFLFFSLWKRIYGLLIPGCILGGLSLGVTFASTSSGASVLWGLSLGFLSIFLVGRALFAQQSQWPIYPSVILFAIGIIIAVASLPLMFAGVFIWLPLLLIVAGLYLGWRRPAY